MPISLYVKLGVYYIFRNGKKVLEYILIIFKIRDVITRFLLCISDKRNLVLDIFIKKFFYEGCFNEKSKKSDHSSDI
jgi:hypothetical protein